jgi:hypothetical protein
MNPVTDSPISAISTARLAVSGRPSGPSLHLTSREQLERRKPQPATQPGVRATCQAFSTAFVQADQSPTFPSRNFRIWRTTNA